MFDKTTGIHLSIKAVHSTGEKQSCTYARNSPFWSQLSESVTTDKGVVSKHHTKYNANWEIITPDMTYSGYDKHNNWTHLQLSEGGYIHRYISYYDTPAIVIEDVQITE